MTGTANPPRTPRRGGRCAKVRIPPFQFSLRTMFIGIAVLAIPCWLVSAQAKIALERRALLDEIRVLGAGRSCAGMPFGMNCSGDFQERHTTFIRRCFGDYAVEVLVLPDDLPADLVRKVRTTFSEAAMFSAPRQKILP